MADTTPPRPLAGRMPLHGREMLELVGSFLDMASLAALCRCHRETRSALVNLMRLAIVIEKASDDLQRVVSSPAGGPDGVRLRWAEFRTRIVASGSRSTDRIAWCTLGKMVRTRALGYRENGIRDPSPWSGDVLILRDKEVLALIRQFYPHEDFLDMVRALLGRRNLDMIDCVASEIDALVASDPGWLRSMPPFGKLYVLRARFEASRGVPNTYINAYGFECVEGIYETALATVRADSTDEQSLTTLARFVDSMNPRETDLERARCRNELIDAARQIRSPTSKGMAHLLASCRRFACRPIREEIATLTVAWWAFILIALAIDYQLSPPSSPVVAVSTVTALFLVSMFLHLQSWVVQMYGLRNLPSGPV